MKRKLNIVLLDRRCPEYPCPVAVACKVNHDEHSCSMHQIHLPKEAEANDGNSCEKMARYLLKHSFQFKHNDNLQEIAKRD